MVLRSIVTLGIKHTHLNVHILSRLNRRQTRLVHHVTHSMMRMFRTIRHHLVNHVQGRIRRQAIIRIVAMGHNLLVRRTQHNIITVRRSNSQNVNNTIRRHIRMLKIIINLRRKMISINTKHMGPARGLKIHLDGYVGVSGQRTTNILVTCVLLLSFLVQLTHLLMTGLYVSGSNNNNGS